MGVFATRLGCVFEDLKNVLESTIRNLGPHKPLTRKFKKKKKMDGCKDSLPVRTIRISLKNLSNPFGLSKEALEMCSGKVVRLKSLYELKLAPRNWFNALRNFLTNDRFVRNSGTFP